MKGCLSGDGVRLAEAHGHAGAEAFEKRVLRACIRRRLQSSVDFITISFSCSERSFSELRPSSKTFLKNFVFCYKYTRTNKRLLSREQVAYGPQITSWGRNYDIQGLTKTTEQKIYFAYAGKPLRWSSFKFWRKQIFLTSFEGEKIKLGPLKKEEISSQNSNLRRVISQTLVSRCYYDHWNKLNWCAKAQVGFRITR